MILPQQKIETISQSKHDDVSRIIVFVLREERVCSRLHCFNSSRIPWPSERMFVTLHVCFLNLQGLKMEILLNSLRNECSLRVLGFQKGSSS